MITDPHNFNLDEYFLT